MPVSTLVFADTETTSLRHDRRIWNIGLVRRTSGGAEISEEIIIRNVDLTNADRVSLAMSHYWRRHPHHGGQLDGATVLEDEAAAAQWLLDRVQPDLVDGEIVPVHIVGAVPDFDVTSFVAMFARHELCWPGHYHLVDAENVAVGALAARGVLMRPPYSSSRLCELLGVDTARYTAHTALADARWAKDLYDAATRLVADDPPAVVAALEEARQGAHKAASAA